MDLIIVPTMLTSARSFLVIGTIGKQYPDSGNHSGAASGSDCFLREYFKIIKDYVGTGTQNPDGSTSAKLAPMSDNILINGKMNFNCSSVNDGVPCECTDLHFNRLR